MIKGGIILKTRISIILVIVLLLSLMGACAQNESLADSTSGLSGNDPLSVLGAVGNVGEEMTPESLTPAEQYLRGSIIVPSAEEPIVVSEETNTQGQYTLDFCQGWPGLFVRYEDGSFDRYNGGAVFTWDDNYMTYGTDNFPRDLVISLGTVESNAKKLAEGELVLFWPYDNRVRSGLYKVEESGYSLVRKDEDGDLEGLFITRANESGTGFVQWNQGKTFYWSNSINYSTINGISKELYEDFPSAEGREFASFPANQKFTIGVTEGTTLVEKEYSTDYMYLIQSDESSNYQQTATADGYAVLDFSDTEPGEYIFTVSYWNEDRRVREVISTYIVID